MKLQLHITGKCNLRCKHCYIAEHADELDYESFLCVMEQFDALSEQVQNGVEEKPTVHITGGEPFLHRDIHKILNFFAERKDKYAFGILSNGTVLNKEFLDLTVKAAPNPFQVSIDGIEQTHDAIRGKGNLKKVLAGIDALVERGIPVQVSFTAHRGNYREFPKIAALCRTHGVKRLWSDRYIPCSEANLEPLTREDMFYYVDLISTEHVNSMNKAAGLTVRNNRALQFLLTKSMPHRCLAGESIIVVDEKGNIMPCRRLPLIRGNIRGTTLSKVYFSDPIFRELRSCISVGKCSSCIHRNTCRGGERCFTYAVTKDYSMPDPCCWL